jgi:hypothetical protein
MLNSSEIVRQKPFGSNATGTRGAKVTTTMLNKLPPAYLKFAESTYGRQFTSDADLIHALQNENFKKRANFLRIMTESFGFEFSSPLEVFRLVSGERLADFGPLSPAPGTPTAFQVAAKAFGRNFATPKDLADFIDEVPSREKTFQKALIAAGWRAKRKKPTRRISLEKADELFSGLVKRVAQANSNRKFAFFVQEILVYGSYMRREKTVGDIDIAMQFAMKVQAKVDERISFYMRRNQVEWREGYNRAITEVSSFLTSRSKYFHDSDAALVKRSFPYEVVYKMPALKKYERLVSQTDGLNDVEHLHEFLEKAELSRASITTQPSNALIRERSRS